MNPIKENAAHDCNGGGGGGGTEPPKECKVVMTGYVECCCDEPGTDVRDFVPELVKLPCSTTCDEAYTFISNFLAANPGAVLTEAMNFYNDGWLLVFNVPPAP